MGTGDWGPVAALRASCSFNPMSILWHKNWGGTLRLESLGTLQRIRQPTKKPLLTGSNGLTLHGLHYYILKIDRSIEKSHFHTSNKGYARLGAGRTSLFRKASLSDTFWVFISTEQHDDFCSFCLGEDNHWLDSPAVATGVYE